MVINTNIKAMLGKLSERERRLFLDDISERQDTARFFKTVETLSYLTPIHIDEMKSAVSHLVGSDWEKATQYHPAYKIERVKVELKNLLNMLSDCTRVAVEAYGELHDIASKDYDKKLYRDDLTLRIGKEFYTFVHLAQSLVDVGRRYRKYKAKLCPDADSTRTYNELVTSSYCDEMNKIFVVEMRNNLSHFILHRPGWRISTSIEQPQPESGYVFDTAYLAYRGNWKSPKFNEYLRQTEKIDIYTEMLKYFKASKKFLDALMEFDEENLSEAETHLRAAEFLREGMQIKFSFGIWKQALANRPDIDPFKYLDKYFSENEIRLIMKLPKHTKEQADFMIELGDKWGVCDDITRKNIYEILKVTDKALHDTSPIQSQETYHKTRFSHSHSP